MIQISSLILLILSEKMTPISLITCKMQYIWSLLTLKSKIYRNTSNSNILSIPLRLFSRECWRVSKFCAWCNVLANFFLSCLGREMWHHIGAILAYLRAIWLGVVRLHQMGWFDGLVVLLLLVVFVDDLYFRLDIPGLIEFRGVLFCCRGNERFRVHQHLQILTHTKHIYNI